MTFLLAQTDYIPLIVASGVPSLLMVWLHLRLNSIDKAHKEDIIRLDREVSRKVGAIYEHMEARDKEYVHRDTLKAQLNTINVGLSGLTARVGDFVALMQAIDAKQDSQGERLSKVEAAAN